MTVVTFDGTNWANQPRGEQQDRQDSHNRNQGIAPDQGIAGLRRAATTNRNAAQGDRHCARPRGVQCCPPLNVFRVIPDLGKGRLKDIAQNETGVIAGGKG